MSRKYPISEDDMALFKETMRDVTPLGQPEKPTHIKKSIPKPDPIHTTWSNHYHDPVDAEGVLSYSRHVIPPKHWQQFVKAQSTYQARLDLHGLNPDAARDSLARFMHAQINKKHRLLLIIHGKGGYLGQTPILKNLVNVWLPQIDEVLAFHSALPKDGGQGAVYVLLKHQHGR